MTSFEYIEPRARVEIHGIKAKPELNGRVGDGDGVRPGAREISRARERRRRRRERRDGGATEEVYLKPDNVRKAETTAKATTTKATKEAEAEARADAAGGDDDAGRGRDDV